MTFYSAPKPTESTGYLGQGGQMQLKLSHQYNLINLNTYTVVILAGRKNNFHLPKYTFIKVTFIPVQHTVLRTANRKVANKITITKTVNHEQREQARDLISWFLCIRNISTNIHLLLKAIHTLALTAKQLLKL